jgi:hypothetical protein
MIRVYAVACVQFLRLTKPAEGQEPTLERHITKTVAVEGYAEAAVERVRDLVNAEPPRADCAVTGFEVVTVALQNLAE